MKLINFLSGQLKGFNLFEKIIFPLEIILIVFISFLIGDSKIALISTLAGLCYTILAGKGKISCYFIGLCGTFCYCYIAYKNGFYGNLALYGLFFFPSQVIGIFKWFRHIDKDTHSIVKTSLSKKERILYFLLMLFLTICAYFILYFLNGKNPLIDSITTIFSIFAQILTIKRCIEQWYIWFFVNVLSLFMWIVAYLNGSNCFVTIFMWATYVFLAVYFLNQWKKEIATSNLDNSK